MKEKHREIFTWGPNLVERLRMDFFGVVTFRLRDEG